MAIKYSLSAHPADPSDKDSRLMRVYPRAQYNEYLTIKDLAYHIYTHGSPFDEAIIEGVLLTLVKCIHERLVKGDRIQLGDFGTLQATLHSKGAESAEKFRPEDDIEAVSVHWTPGEKFRDLLDDPNIKFEYSLTRKELNDALRLSQAALDKEMERKRPGSRSASRPDQDPLE